MNFCWPRMENFGDKLQRVESVPGKKCTHLPIRIQECQICFDFIDGTVLASCLTESVRSKDLTQTTSQDSAIYEIKINLA